MAYPSQQAATGRRAQAGAEALGLGAQVAAADTEHGQATAAGAQQKMSAGWAQHHQGRGLGARDLAAWAVLAAAMGQQAAARMALLGPDMAVEPGHGAQAQAMGNRPAAAKAWERAELLALTRQGAAVREA